MSFPRPDTGNFNRLIVSLGVACIAVALLVPWLVLREDGALRIRDAELGRLTKTADEALRSRQETLADIQSVWWVFTIVFFLIGALLLAWGAVRLHRQQSVEDRTLSAQANHAEKLAGLEAQTEEERDQQIAADQKVAAVAGQGPSDPPVGDAGGGPERRAQGPPAVERARSIEQRVFDQLRTVTPPGYEFVPEVKVSGPRKEDQPLYLDAVFTSRDEGRPDILVEVKVTSRLVLPMARLYVDQLLASMSRYEAMIDRPCKGWLIVILDCEVDDEAHGRIMRQLLKYGHPALAFEVVSADSLSEITRLPLARLAKLGQKLRRAGG